MKATSQKSFVRCPTPNHGGINVAHRPCYRCGYSVEAVHTNPKPETERTHLSLVTDGEGKSSDMQGAFTASTETKSFTIDASNADIIAENARKALETYPNEVNHDKAEGVTATIAGSLYGVTIPDMPDVAPTLTDLYGQPVPEPEFRFDTGTGEIQGDARPGQLLLGLDLPALTQRKGQTDGMTREQATRAVVQAVASMGEGDRVTITWKDGIVVKIVEGWRAE